MSKKSNLIIFVFIPSIIGWIYNSIFIFSIPLLGSLLLYIPAIFMFCFWFWVGRKFAQMNIKPFPSILIGNSLGIVSLLLYLWQFIIVSDGNRNIHLAALSQAFSATISFFIVRFAILFEPQKNVISQTTAIATQTLGLILMIIIFTIGYYSNKIKVNSNLM